MKFLILFLSLAIAAKANQIHCAAIVNPTEAVEARYILNENLQTYYLTEPTEFVGSDGQTYQIAPISTKSPKVASAISALLRQTIETAREVNGGHLPSPIVDRIQEGPISVKGVQEKWAEFGIRYVVTKKVDEVYSELVANILVARNHETIFFISRNYDNLLPRYTNTGEFQHFFNKAGQYLDSYVASQNVPSDLPPLGELKPARHHQIINFAVHPSYQGRGLAREVLNYVIKTIRSRATDRRGKPLFVHPDGKGFFQVGETPWQDRMRPMNFFADPSRHVYMIGQDPIPQTGSLTNFEFNKSWRVFEEYYLAFEYILRRNPGEILRRDVLEALSEPEMIEAKERVLANPKFYQKFRDDLEYSGLRHPSRVAHLFWYARNGGEQGPKLQYKLLQATFDDVTASKRRPKMGSD